MILAPLPPAIQIAVLAILGTVVGAFINWAVYQWSFFRTRTVSPWQSKAADASKRNPVDYIPIIGWLSLRRDHKLHGHGFWIRPLLIELSWAIGLPLFFLWHMGGGLYGNVMVINPVADVEWRTEIWFWAHSILIALMFIATFIDFDEQMIPDEVTVPGTLIALFIAALLPEFRLPELSMTAAGWSLESVTFNSPIDLPAWYTGVGGLFSALGIYLLWIFALLPKIPADRFGLSKSIRLMAAHNLRPKRKTKCDIRIRERSMRPGLKILIGICVVGILLITTAWLLLNTKTGWTSLFGSLVGMLVAGLLVWAIRIVGGWAMQQEAMGFGDVTLMIMIGAFLGWQASILTFVASPFAALAITLFTYLATRRTDLAFGPYLCLGALLLVFFWDGVWPGAANSFFSIGIGWFSLIIAAALVLMPLMLMGMLWLKGPLDEEDVD